MANKERPRVLVVILNLNGKGFLEDCLDSIKENTGYPENSREVLVVDNGSEDGSDQRAEELGFRVERLGRNLGFDIGNNVGIYKNPDYDFYLLMNNDTEVKENWLTELAKTAQEDEVGVVGPKIMYPDEEIQSAGFSMNGAESFNLREGLPRGDFWEEDFVDAVHGSAIMIGRDVIDDIGYLDEMFTLGNSEEWDYCCRAREAGYKIKVNGSSEIIHKEDKTKENIDNELLYLLTVKNQLKHKVMNGTKTQILQEFYGFGKKLGASIIGYRYNPFNALKNAIKEFIVDLPLLVHKRYNRTEFIPSYYCEGIKDYSQRYESYID